MLLGASESLWIQMGLDSMVLSSTDRPMVLDSTVRSMGSCLLSQTSIDSSMLIDACGQEHRSCRLRHDWSIDRSKELVFVLSQRSNLKAYLKKIHGAILSFIFYQTLCFIFYQTLYIGLIYLSLWLIYLLVVVDILMTVVDILNMLWLIYLSIVKKVQNFL